MLLKLCAIPLTDNPVDRTIPGIYQIELDASGININQAASAALEAFLNQNPIKHTQDFDFILLDANGQSVEEYPDHDSYELADRVAAIKKVSDKAPAFA